MPWPVQDAGVEAGLPLPDVPHTLREVRANGLVFNVWEAGPADGEAVLLLHGFPQTSHEWRALVPALVAHGYRVIAPDQRGYSPKARPTRDEDYAVIYMANDAVALADALSARAFHVVGHDWGGGVAWLVARLVPERVMSLTVLGTPHPDAMKAALADQTSCQHEASAYFDNVTRPDAAARLRVDPNSVVPDIDLDPLPNQDAYRALLADEAALDAALAWYRANIADRKFTAVGLGPVTTPTLLVIGANERFFCADAAAGSASFVSAAFELVTLPNVGHWIPEQAPEALIAGLLPHLAAQRARVQGTVPGGPDPKRPFAAGLSGFACLGAPAYEVPAEVPACNDVCPGAHCLPASMLGQNAGLIPACPGGTDKCVPDAFSASLGRFVLRTCTPFLMGGRGGCVPKCLAGLLGFVLGADGCGTAELCAPCDNPLTGEPTGACPSQCQGL
jgi:pimeloyl-ACP methyl ester carboxylesterase